MDLKARSQTRLGTGAFTSLVASLPSSDDSTPEIVAAEVRRCRRLSAAQLDLLLAGYGAGTPVAELAENFGVHRATVHAHVRKASLTGRR